MPAFDIIVLGCGGGPSEHNLSSYLLKPHEKSWNYEMISLEAGSGIGSLAQLLRANPDLFGVETTIGNNGSIHTYTAAEVYSWMRCYLITHAHLDHVNSLVLSAGSLKGPPRRIYAAHQTLKDIESIFSDRVWPNLGSWDGNDANGALVYTELHSNGQYETISDSISVRMMPVSHGKSRCDDPYDSAAFFIRHVPSGQEILFFGDVEPDSVAQNPRTLAIWQAAARKIPSLLTSIFIECSWPLGRQDDLLYGHLNPHHLAVELGNLAAEVLKVRQESSGDREPAQEKTSEPRHVRKKQKRNPISPDSLQGALDGVHVYIIHCKEDIFGAYDQPINQVIAEQVRSLTNEQGLGVEIIAVEQGMHISI